MGGVFICYRRDDTADVTGRLYDRLVESFGRPQVFKDVFSIDLGLDFDSVIASALRRTDVLLVLLGKAWTPERLAVPNDPVRKEIEQALDREIRIIPIFVRGASMPREDLLPESMRSFSRLNGMPLRDDPDFDHDVSRLVQSIRPTTAAESQRFDSEIAQAVTYLNAKLGSWPEASFGGDEVLPRLQELVATVEGNFEYRERFPHIWAALYRMMGGAYLLHSRLEMG